MTKVMHSSSKSAGFKLALFLLTGVLMMAFAHELYAPRRVGAIRMKETNNKGVAAVGVVKFKEADMTDSYAAQITFKENDSVLGSRIATVDPDNPVFVEKSPDDKIKL